MEAGLSIPAAAADQNTMKYYYSKRNDSISMDQKRPALGRQMLSNADSSHAPPCNEQFEVGAFYEIDHGKLPPKSPIQLKAIRVVKVSEIAKMDVTVSFPSTLSLRNYFSTNPAGDHIPELDERFVMSSNHAGRILRRLIPTSQLADEKQMESFWLVAPLLPTATKSEPEEVTRPTPMSGCLLALKCAGVIGWGIRRKIKYIGRHREMPPSVKKDEEEVMDVQQNGGRKRTRDAGKKEKKKKKERKEKKPRREKVKCEEESRVRGSKDRWSTERYESAELKLLEIMRKKGAELGNPVLRLELREEARKHIGDTGLLDHLLKHMAGKIVTDGTERFRRRHNAEGAMEYWLEPADLVEIRRKAGVMDPYWVPPTGWKLGDATWPCPCGGECKREMSHLREEIAILKRVTEELSSLKHLEKVAEETQSAGDSGCSTWQENYDKLLEWNTKLEAEMARMSSCLQGLKEEVRLLKEEMKEKREERKVVEVVMEEAKGSANVGDAKDEEKRTSDTSASTNISISTTTTTNISSSCSVMGGKKAIRRSGFRICKPQGTFLWPNMGGGGGGSSPYPQGLIRMEDLMLFGGIPTPPSASSATSAPCKLLLPPPTTPTSPVMPRPSAEVIVVVPQQQQQQQQQQEEEERNENISTYSHMARAGGAWSAITTDLALATPPSSTYP